MVKWRLSRDGVLLCSWYDTENRIWHYRMYSRGLDQWFPSHASWKEGTPLKIHEFPLEHQTTIYRFYLHGGTW